MTQNNEHGNLVDLMETVKRSSESIHKEITKKINEFKEEYKRGFKKIIFCETMLNQLKNQVSLMQNSKIKDSCKYMFVLFYLGYRNRLKENENMKKWVDTLMNERIETLWSQINHITERQEQFNQSMSNDITKINSTIKIEIDQVKNENEGVLREVRRVERNITSERALSLSPRTEKNKFFINSPKEYGIRSNNITNYSRVNSPFAKK